MLFRGEFLDFDEGDIEAKRRHVFHADLLESKCILIAGGGTAYACAARVAGRVN